MIVFLFILFCLTVCDMCWSCLTSKYQPKNPNQGINILNFDDHVMTRIYSIYLFQSYFGQSLFQWCLISATNKIPFSWEGKSISKIMCSQKYGDLYIISYLLPTMVFCIGMQLPFYKLWFPLRFKTTPVGNIFPTRFLSQTFLKTIKLWVETIIKPSSCHNGVGSFFYIR